ncbi:MAG: sulfate ABC transporter permease subunit CysW [Thermoanaerobaculia bacterium]
MQHPGPSPRSSGTGFGRNPDGERGVARFLLIATMLGYLCLFLFIPLGFIFWKAFQNGIPAYFAAISESDAISAIKLTLLATVISVPLNILFGLAAAWAITRFEFPGKTLLTTLIDLPLSMSPVISGMLFILLFGMSGILGPLLGKLGVDIVFAVPGIVLATAFVTMPYIARELVGFMQTVGREEEEAAVSLGAPGWATFFRVTLPSIKWSLLYGIVLCAARSVGEFGAVSVVSGHIRGATNTLTLHVEILYNEYRFADAFAVASLLTLIALVAIGAKAGLTRVRSSTVEGLSSKFEVRSSKSGA